MRVVITAGTFDLLHQGHLNLFKACRLIAGGNGKVIVYVNTDDFVKKFKGKIPMMDIWTRVAIISGLKYVDQVHSHRGEGRSTMANFLDEARNLSWGDAIFLVVGSDWAKKDYYKQIGLTQEELDKASIQLIYAPYTFGVSSSEIRERMKT